MQIAALVGELRVSCQTKIGPSHSSQRPRVAPKMTVEDLTFFNSWVGDKPISRFRVGPILALRTIGLARAKMKIGLANLAYNMRRSVWLHARTAAA